MQAEVETAQLYILARCPSTDQQITYSDTRMEDIKSLSKPLTTEEGIVIYDVMRFLKG